MVPRPPNPGETLLSYGCMECTLQWKLQEGPGEAAVAALGEASETPERLWTPDMRATTAEELAHLATQAHAAQVTLTPPLHLGLFSFCVLPTLHLLLIGPCWVIVIPPLHLGLLSFWVD